VISGRPASHHAGRPTHQLAVGRSFMYPDGV